MNKAAQVIKNLSQGFLISGILSALMGAYYLFAKAGLPLQDPPLALKIQYEIDFGVGEKMLMLGLTCLFIGCVGYTVAWICSKKPIISQITKGRLKLVFIIINAIGVSIKRSFLMIR